jgi:ubiquinol-cytochrome c reductase iron-sulfur subunit
MSSQARRRSAAAEAGEDNAEALDLPELDVIAARVPPPSQANDAIVIGTAVGAAVCAVGFGILLLLNAPLRAYASLLALAMLLMAISVRRYFTDRYPDIDAVEPRLPAPRDEIALADIEPVVGRRPLLTRILIGSATVLGLSFLVPVSSLGPSPDSQLRTTPWRLGRRVVTGNGQPLRPGDIAPGGVVTAWPEGAIGAEQAAVVVLRLTNPPQPPTVSEWIVDGAVVAYSKICTHAGCPVALYRERDNVLFCPCHQSTFDANRGAVVTFGPAKRALPQLPLGVENGELIALGDFVEQVGPAFG